MKHSTKNFMFKLFSEKKAYIFWLLLYMLLFWLVLGANIISFLIVLGVYSASIVFALSPYAEALWRAVSGVRPLRLRIEKDRLLPLFEEVYDKGTYRKGIKLYIKEDMDVNAFSFGRGTLVLTRGSIEMLSDDGLKGLMAHEFGHFYNRDTIVLLFATVGNFFVSLFMNMLNNIKKHMDIWSKESIMVGFLKIFFDIIYYFFKMIQFIGELVLMHTSRKSEYEADEFAYGAEYGKELADVLTQIYMTSITKPKSIKEQLKSSHPPLTMRIERLENRIY